MNEVDNSASQKRLPMFETIKRLVVEISSFERNWQQQKKALKVNSKDENQGTPTNGGPGRSEICVD